MKYADLDFDVENNLFLLNIYHLLNIYSANQKCLLPFDIFDISNMPISTFMSKIIFMTGLTCGKYFIKIIFDIIRAIDNWL